MLTDLIAFCDNPTIDSPWLSSSCSILVGVVGEDGRIQREFLPYKALGPLTLTYYMRHHNETGQVLPEWAHKPLRPRQVLRGARPILRRTDFSQSYSIHLYASHLHRKLKEAGLTSAPEGSFLAHLLRDHGMDLVIYRTRAD